MVTLADWKETELRSVLKFQVGFPFSSQSFASNGIGIRLIRNADLKSSSTAVSIVGAYPKEFEVQSGDLLIGMDGDFAPMIWKGGFALLNQRVGRVICGSEMNKGYARYELASHLKAIELSTGATTVKHLSHDDVASIVLKLPPLKEQEAIAEALSDADEAIESLNALITKKRDVKQATMQQLLTGRTRLPGFTAEWKEVRLGDICEFVKTIALSRSQLEADHGVGCIHYGDIHTRFNDRLDCSNVQLPMAESGMVAGVPRLKVGDLVIADASEDMTGVGKGIEILGIPEYGVVAGLHTAVLRPHVGHFAKGFLGQLQHMPKFREQARVLASGLKVYGLSKTSISKISVEIPPLKEQEAIAEVLSVMDDELEVLTEQVSKLRMVKEGMMQDLLTGKVRLV